MNKYDKIINLKHYDPKFHKRMSIENRSCQFAPFSALTGYDDDVKEAGRITEDERRLTEEDIDEINKALILIKSNIKDMPLVKITYFIKDNKKRGGKYNTLIARVKKIDEFKNFIVLDNNEKIFLKNIKEIILDLYNK